MQRTELFIRPVREGTLSITDGSVTLTGTGTNFTSADIGKNIRIRTSQGIKVRVIDSVASVTSADVTSALDITESLCYYTIDTVQIDLYENFPYSLNYNIADIREPEKRNTSYSKTIKIPGTKANNIVFDNIFEIDNEGSFNPNLRADAIVYSDMVPVFIGNLQLLKINKDENSGKIEYEVCVFGKNGDLFQKIGGRYLTDLDLSSLNEVGDESQITSSWAVNNDLFYPLLNNGRQIFDTATPSFLCERIAPSIRASKIFEQILSEAGYSVSDSATLYGATFLDNLYVPCLKDWRRKATVNLTLRAKYNNSGNTGEVFMRIYRARSGTVESVSTSLTLGDVYSTLNFVTDIELDYGDKLYFEIVPDAGNVFGAITESATDTRLIITFNDTIFTYNKSGNIDVYLAADTNIPGAGTATVRARFIDINVNDNSSWNVLLREHTTPAKNTQGFLPDNFLQKDFLLGLIRMFNLYLEPDADNEFVINILPRDTYYSQGGIVDWTSKLDVSKEIELTPMGDLDFKTFRLTWKQDSDFYNSDYQKKTSKVYGEKIIQVENDFQTNEKIIEVPFAPFPLTGSTYHNMVLPGCVKENMNTATNQFAGILRLIYWRVYPETETFIMNGNSYNVYPFCGHLKGSLSSPQFDFNFAAPQYLNVRPSSIALADYPVSNNLYTNFWKNFITEISDQYSKLAVMFLKLSSEDIRTLDFRNKFFIAGTYYRLNKILDYNPNSTLTTKCEFIRIQEAVYSPIPNYDPVVVSTGPRESWQLGSSLPTDNIMIGDVNGNAQPKEVLGDVSMTGGRTNVVAIQNNPVKSDAPSNSDVLTWVVDVGDPTNTGWKPRAPSGSGFDPTTISGWDANNPDLVLAPVGDGSSNLVWKQNA